MPSGLLVASIAEIAVAGANAGFGVLAASTFVDAAYKFKGATWWVYVLVALMGFSAMLVSAASAIGMFLALWKLGLIADLNDVAKGFVWLTMWLTAVFALSAGYRLTMRRRMLRILDRGIAIGLH